MFQFVRGSQEALCADRMNLDPGEARRDFRRNLELHQAARRLPRSQARIAARPSGT